MRKLLFRNFKIITEDEVLIGYNLTVAGENIHSIFKGEASGEFDLIIEGNGMFLSPGFIDIHNHGNSGYDVMDGTPKALEEMAKFHLKNGVTGFLAATMTASHQDIINAIDNANRFIEKNCASENFSRLLGIYVEGPYFNSENKGAQKQEHIRELSIKELDEYIDAGKDSLKIISIAPETEGASSGIENIVKNGIIAACGHSKGTYEEIVSAIDRGVTLATHLYNGMRSFHHREPGIVGAALLDERIACEIICDGIHVHYGAVDIAYKLKGRKNLILISDAMRAAGMEDGIYELGGQDVIVSRGEARLKDGSLAGSTLTLNRAVKNLISNLHIPLEDAVFMASLSGAKVIGIDDESGSIKEGKLADLIIFDDEINIKSVFLKGKKVL